MSVGNQTNEKVPKVREGLITRTALLNLLEDLYETKVELEKAKDYTDNIIKSMADTLIVVSPDATIQTVNRATLNLLGYEENDLIGKPVGMIFAEEEEEEEEVSLFKGTELEYLIKKGFVRDVETTYLKKDGRKIPVLFSGSVMRDDNGVIQGIVCVAADITERKRAKMAVIRRNEELAARNAIAAALSESIELDEMLNKIIDKVMEVVDTEGVVILLLDEEAKTVRAAAHRGVPPELIERLGEIKVEEGIVLQTVLSGRPYTAEDYPEEARFSEVEKKFGEQYRSITAIPLRSKNKVLGVMGLAKEAPGGFNSNTPPLLTAIGNQIGMAIENANLYANLEEKVKDRTAKLQVANTKLEQAYKELRETQTQLLRAAKLSAIGELAAGVAHEVNNSLGAISGYAEILHDEKGISETAKAYLARMEKRIDDIARIVTGLKDFSGTYVHADLHLKPTDVDDVLQSALELVEEQLRHQSIEVIKEFEKHLPQISADAGRLQQVFLNIILNAKDAMPDGGTLRIKTETVDEGKSIQLLFVDTGTGIRKEHLDRIFNPFFTTKPVGKGTGLGLAISYGIIKEHAGEIDVESEEGQGSTFKIILPTETQQRIWK